MKQSNSYCYSKYHSFMLITVQIIWFKNFFYRYSSKTKFRLQLQPLSYRFSVSFEHQYANAISINFDLCEFPDIDLKEIHSVLKNL